jgi:hypothetical protein
MVWILLIGLFEVKHAFGDYFLQTSGMSGAKRLPWFPWGNWFLPLTAHCAVHAGLSALLIVGISFLYQDISTFLWLALMDFGTHFVMDRAKGYFDGLWHLSSSSTVMAWTLLVVDQAIHHAMNFYAVFKIGQHLTK